MDGLFGSMRVLLNYILNEYLLILNRIEWQNKNKKKLVDEQSQFKEK